MSSMKVHNSDLYSGRTPKHTGQSLDNGLPWEAPKVNQVRGSFFRDQASSMQNVQYGYETQNLQTVLDQMRDEGRADIDEITERMYFQRRFSDAIRDYKRNKEVYEDDIIDVDTLQKPEPTYLRRKKSTS